MRRSNSFLIKDFFDSNKRLYRNLLKFLEDASMDNFPDFIVKVPQSLFSNHDDIFHFLRLLASISNNYHRTPKLIQQIVKVIKYFKPDINKSNFSNSELFNIFAKNKLILLFLIEEEVIEIDKPVIELILNLRELNGIQFCHFFLPEIKASIELKEFIELKKFIETETKRIEDEISVNFPTSLDNFEEKRKTGENDSYICGLIRSDSVEEFISHITMMKMSVNSLIQPSIFETNPFLNEKQTTIIEYASFHGSIQIFRYLVMNGVNLTSSLWLYVIHSKNAELVHVLEEYNVPLPNDSYEQCFLESIKCHHYDFAEYFNINFLDGNVSENANEYAVTYYNYCYFPTAYFTSFAFFLFCKGGFYDIVNIILKSKKDEIENKLISS